MSWVKNDGKVIYKLYIYLHYTSLYIFHTKYNSLETINWLPDFGKVVYNLLYICISFHSFWAWTLGPTPRRQRWTHAKQQVPSPRAPLHKNRYAKKILPTRVLCVAAAQIQMRLDHQWKEYRKECRRGRETTILS